MNINKKTQTSETQFFYSEDEKALGPFNIAQLLEKITRDHLVWREGMEWTAAKNVPELSKFFEHSEPVISKPRSMFSAPFSFEGRIRRMEYGISIIIYYIALLLVTVMAEESSVFGILFLPLIWFILAQGTKRCHDRDNSGFYQFIPFYVLWLLFAEGDSTTNSYGTPAK
jgi:uncharacterized membrane protein YhaH (DUF805 family)